MLGNILVRRMGEHDVEVVRAMQGLSLCGSAKGHGARADDLRALRWMMDDPSPEGTTRFIAETAGGFAVGSVGWGLATPRLAYPPDTIAPLQGRVPKIRAVFVHPDWTHLGIGTALMEEAEASIASAGHRLVELVSISPSRAFFGRLGYETLGTVTSFAHGLALVKMRKALA